MPTWGKTKKDQPYVKEGTGKINEHPMGFVDHANPTSTDKTLNALLEKEKFLSRIPPEGWRVARLRRRGWTGKLDSAFDIKRAELSLSEFNKKVAPNTLIGLENTIISPYMTIKKSKSGEAHRYGEASEAQINYLRRFGHVGEIRDAKHARELIEKYKTEKLTAGKMPSQETIVTEEALRERQLEHERLNDRRSPAEIVRERIEARRKEEKREKRRNKK